MIRFHGTDPESIRRRLTEIAEAERYRRSIIRRVVCSILVWVVVALAVMAWGCHISDAELGPAIFFSGAALGNLGILVTLLWAYHASEN